MKHLLLATLFPFMLMACDQADSATEVKTEVKAKVPAKSLPAKSQAPAKVDLVKGQQAYTQACAFCHDKGIAGAPKTGDKAAWSARLAKGNEALYTSALKGKGAMPAKGGNPSLADDKVKAAVDYLVAKSR